MIRRRGIAGTVLALCSIVATSANAQRARDTVRVARDTPPRWGSAVRLVPAYTLGTLEGPPEYAFGELGEITVDRRGRVYAYDEKDHQIRAYDSTGRFVTKVGQRGAGPGEYNRVAAMTIVADTLLATFDPSLARITLFLPTGKLFRTISEPRANSWGGATFFGDRAGKVFVRIPLRGERATALGPPVGPAADARFLGFNTLGQRVDSIDVVFPRSTVARPRSFYIMLPEGGHYAFVPSPTIAPTPDGTIVAGLGETMRLTLTPRTGPVRIVERSWKAVPVGSAERANWGEWATYMSKQDEGRRSYTIPAIKPAFNSFSIDADGRIWVSLFAAAEKRDVTPRAPGDKRPLLVWRQRATYDVYDSAGVYLARIVLPHAQSFVHASGDRVWAMGKGPDDEQLITMYRVMR